MRSTLPEFGFLRIEQIIGDSEKEPPVPAIIPVGRTTWWAGVRSGRYPQPVRSLGPRITVWRVEEIRTLVEQGATERESSSDEHSEDRVTARQ